MIQTMYSGAISQCIIIHNVYILIIVQVYAKYTNVDGTNKAF